MTTDENDIVLDPFVGTGTTAIAAKRLGRRFIGIDIDPDYVRLSRSKLEATTPSIINGVYVSTYLGKVLSIRDIDYPQLVGYQIEKPKLSGHKKQLALHLKEKNGLYESFKAVD